MVRGRKGGEVFTARATLVLCAFVAAGVSGRQGLPAQVKTKPAQPSIQHQVTVTLKLIQVFVTDAKGKPAMDLERSDFVLYDNGASQTITEFEKHVPAAPAAERATAAAPPSGREAASLLNRKFIFLIDFVRNELSGVMKAKTAALEFMDTKIQPGDEVALFSLSVMGGLKLHEYLTTDHAKVRAAVKKLRDVPGISESGMSNVSPDHQPMGMELMTLQIFASQGGPDGSGVRNLFSEVAQWAKALRAIPGQKNIILFSRGFGEGLVQRRDPGSALFQVMARELASANAPVFTVNTTTGVGAKIARGVFPEASLEFLSKTTGGTYFGDVNFYSRIAADIQDATANYYVLGFTIPAAWDGKFHDIKVEVRKPGHTIHAQRGYFNPLPFNKLSPIEKHLHLLDLALAEKASSKRNLDFPLTAVPFSNNKDANALLLSEIPVLSVRDAVGDRTEFISLIFDRNKSLVDGKRVELDWADFRAEKLYQYAAVALAPGQYDCRAVIRNLDDGRAAVGACSVEVSGPPSEGPALFPPLFLVRGPEALYLNVAAQAKGDTKDGISISGIFPFPPKEYVPLVGVLAAGQASLYAALRCVGMGNREGELELSAWISAEAGGEKAEVGLSLLNSSTQDEADCHLFEFELPELIPGRYRFEILAEDKTTGSTLRTAGWLSVRPPG
jgi:VWFA-related protein